MRALRCENGRGRFVLTRPGEVAVRSASRLARCTNSIWCPKGEPPARACPQLSARLRALTGGRAAQASELDGGRLAECGALRRLRRVGATDWMASVVCSLLLAHGGAACDREWGRPVGKAYDLGQPTIGKWEKHCSGDLPAAHVARDRRGRAGAPELWRRGTTRAEGPAPAAWCCRACGAGR